MNLTIRYSLPIVLAGFWIAAAGCTETPHPPSETEAVAAAGDKPAAVETVETEPAHRVGTFYLAAQPTADDLARWRELGVRAVINLRMPDEVDWDERAAVEELGMRYISVPFAGPETLTDEVIERSLDALADEEHHPVLLHCATSNRTGAIWYAYRVAHDGLDRAAALEEARQIGLRTTGYIEQVDRYLDAHSIF